MVFLGDSLTPKKQPWQVFTDISSVALVEAQETFEANHLMVETLLGDFFEPLEGVVETTGMLRWSKTVVQTDGVFWVRKLRRDWLVGVDWLMGVDWLDFAGW